MRSTSATPASTWRALLSTTRTWSRAGWITSSTSIPTTDIRRPSGYPLSWSSRRTTRAPRAPPKALSGERFRAMFGRTVFVATYPPRRCGIATFTRNLADSTGDHEIAVLRAPGDPDAYASEVRHRIRRDVLADYLEVARKLNRSSVGVVSVQHEFGIWGGDDGEFVLDFVGALTKPVVTTLHTVPPVSYTHLRAHE